MKTIMAKAGSEETAPQGEAATVVHVAAGRVAYGRLRDGRVVTFDITGDVRPWSKVRVLVQPEGVLYLGGM